MTIRILLLVVSLWGATARASDSGDVSLNNAWIRALPPTQSVTAAYLEVHNAAAIARVVTGATIEGAGRVEIHHTVTENGLTSMQQLSTLTVEAGATTRLAPGGVHLMVFELEAMPRAGEKRRLCLELEAGTEACVDAQVRKSAPDSSHAHH